MKWAKNTFVSQILGQCQKENHPKPRTYSGCTIEICINYLEWEEVEVGARTTQGMDSHKSCVSWVGILEISLITG